MQCFYNVVTIMNDKYWHEFYPQFSVSQFCLRPQIKTPPEYYGDRNDDRQGNMKQIKAHVKKWDDNYKLW